MLTSKISKKVGDSMGLEEKKCTACAKGQEPLKGNVLNEYMQKINEWQLMDQCKIEKTFTFSNFAKALAFTNKIGELAEQEKHHPDIYLAWGKVKVSLWTHKIDGLSENDFILAAKIDQISIQ